MALVVAFHRDVVEPRDHLGREKVRVRVRGRAGVRVRARVRARVRVRVRVRASVGLEPRDHRRLVRAEHVAPAKLLTESLAPWLGLGLGLGFRVRVRV